MSNFRDRISSQYAGKRGVIEIRPAILGPHPKTGEPVGLFLVADGYKAAHPYEPVSIPVDISAMVPKETLRELPC